MRECIIRENGSSIFVTGLNGETDKVEFFLGGEMKHQGFDFKRHLYLEEDTFNAKKKRERFFSNIYQICHSKCSFANCFRCSKLLFLTSR